VGINLVIAQIKPQLIGEGITLDGGQSMGVRPHLAISQTVNGFDDLLLFNPILVMPHRCKQRRRPDQDFIIFSPKGVRCSATHIIHITVL